MKAAIYCRVSTAEQARHGESLADQEAALRAFAAEHGHSVVGVYRDEGFSARKSYRTRPAMQALLADVEADSVQIVLFTKLDRWFRNLSDYYKVQEILEAHRVTWQAILEAYETISSAGRFKVNIMLSVAQHEADMASDRIKFTMTEKRKRGELVSGAMPLGYILDGKRPVKDPATSAGVQAYLDTYINTGNKTQATQAALDAGLLITRATGCRILSRPERYAGTMQGSVEAEAYITPEQADQIRSVHEKRPRSKEVYLFSGLARCGTCGAAYIGHRNGPNHYLSYHCAKCANSRGMLCDQRVYLSERLIEQAILDRLAPELDRLVLEATVQQDGNEDAETEKRVQRLQERRKRGFDAYLAGVVSLEEFETARAAIDAELAELERPRQSRDPETLRAILPSGWRAIYDDMSKPGRRAFWLRILESVTIQPDRAVSFSFRM